MTTYRIGDIRPNPFRDRDNYPIDEEKVADFQADFRANGIWPVIEARLVDGAPELAYGHHRLEAALREYGKNLPDSGLFGRMKAEG